MPGVIFLTTILYWALREGFDISRSCDSFGFVEGRVHIREEVKEQRLMRISMELDSSILVSG